MGNASYRISPRKFFNSASGTTSCFEFAANQITGWRNSQEDRYVCLPNFDKDFSLFAVYDGHGGEEVVQYLERFLHQFISRELELTKDVELALYLSFLNCDNCLRTISDAEYALIENDLVKEFEVPDKEERRRVLFGSIAAAGSSGKNLVQDELRAAIVSSCIKELPSISFLTQAPVQESDESDDDYQPGDEDIDFLTDEMDSSDEISQRDDSPESYSQESIEDKKTKKHTASTLKQDAGSSTWTDVAENADQNDTSTVKDVKEKKEEQEGNEEQKDFGKQIGMHCGSTASVLLINKTHIYVAHVGDSRCVACIKGQAVDLSTDHRPTDKDELDRIINAGGSVSEDGRIEGDIDMSRAFGDFRYKAIDSITHMMSVEPSITTIKITPDLEFIIVASDGIWNTMDSQDVVAYIKNRICDPSLELQDLCGELFEELVPEQITADGSGCDNMTAIIIKLNNTQGLAYSSKNAICYHAVYEYNYKTSESSTKENLVKKDKEKEILQSKVDEIKDCEESSPLKLDEDNLNHETYIKSKYEEQIYSSESNEECKEYEPGFDGKKVIKSKDEEISWFSLSSKECCESGLHENKANCEFDEKMEIEGNSFSPENSKSLDYVERISTHEEQQLYTSNKDCWDLASVMAARPDQQAQNAPLNNEENSPQLERNNSNLLQNCRRQSIDYQPFPIQRAINMHKIMQSLTYIDGAIQSLSSEMSSLKTLVNNEIICYNNYRQSQTPTDTDIPHILIDLTGENNQNHQSVEQGEVDSEVDCEAKQSPSVQMETDFVNLANKKIQNPEQCVERDEVVDNGVMQSPVMQMKTKFVEGPSKEIQIPKQSALEEIVPKRIGSAVFQSNIIHILNDPVSLTNEEMLNPEKDEVVYIAAMQSPTMLMETNPVRLTNKDKDPGQSVEEDEVVELAVIQSSTKQISPEIQVVDLTEGAQNPQQPVEKEAVPQSVDSTCTKTMPVKEILICRK